MGRARTGSEFDISIGKKKNTKQMQISRVQKGTTSFQNFKKTLR